MDIQNCTLTDANKILELYGAAMALQTEKKMVIWPKFEKAFIENEINEKRQWKLLINDEIACNWAITFDDKEIWGAKDQNDSIYIHRIATNPSFRGNRFINAIVSWAISYASSIGKKFVRLDTLGNNTKLIDHYKSAGFDFLGMHLLTDTKNLPDHYKKEPNCCLFELEIK